MAVGRGLAGRQAGRRAGWLAGWRADEQAGPSDANYCIAPLQLWRNTGTESGTQVSREDGREGGGGRGREDHIQRWGGGVKLELLMQERRKPSLHVSLLLSQQKRIIVQLQQKEGRIEAFWESHRNLTDCMVTGAPPGLPSCSDYCCQSMCSTSTVAPCTSAQNLRPVFENIFQNSKSLFIPTWQAKGIQV